MFGILYLLLAGLLGKEMTEGFLLRKKETTTELNELWTLLPASFGVGTLILTWGTYAVSWVFSVCADMKNPLFYGNFIVMTVAALALYLQYRNRQRREKGILRGRLLIRNKALFYRECVLFGILFLFITWILFFVFYIKDGVLYSGFTVFSDYAPHTAMIRSFSWENNFPTQYPHFGGEDVKYHFMFQFLTGNLEYLGLRLDLAYNGVSILSLLGFLMLLYSLCRRMSGGFLAGVFACALFFVRSGTAFFRFAWEHIKAGDFLQTLLTNTAFVGYTPNENWGLWNFNVYLNQRHLAFGMLLAAMAVLLYLDWLEAGTSHKEKGFLWLKSRLFTQEAWRSRDWRTALFTGLVLGLCSFWNGATVIGALLILMGFGLFSDGKLDYAITAAVAVTLSFLQTKIFITGQSIRASFYFGFLAEDKSLWGVLTYLFEISGFYFLGLVFLCLLFQRRERSAALAFCMPVFFAFTASLTPDINVNHKYIMIAYAFLTILWGMELAKLFLGEWRKKAAAAILAVCLTATGVYDFWVILLDNDKNHRVSVNMESSLSQWLSDNLDSTDLILTPQYSMNEVTMSGAMMYCGWPYYAWSAGYDTYYREGVATEIYTTEDANRLKQLAEQEGITYILFEQDLELEGQKCREETIAEVYECVYISEDGRIRIYET